MSIAAGWVPWLLYLDRTIFTFYSVVMAPFVCIALAMTLGTILGPTDADPRRRTIGATAVGSILLLALIAAMVMAERHVDPAGDSFAPRASALPGSEDEQQFTQRGLEETAVVEAANQHFRQFTDFLGALRHAELLDEVILQRHRRREGIEHELPLLLVLAGAGGTAGALLHVVAPLLIHGGEAAEFLIEPIVVEVVFLRGVLDGNLGGFHFQHGILLHFQLHHLPQFKDGSLEDIQALLQLGREPLLLTEVLSEVRSNTHRPQPCGELCEKQAHIVPLAFCFLTGILIKPAS